MPMMRSRYLMHFCGHCMRDQEHIQLTYAEQATLTCQFCQETHEVDVNNNGDIVKKSFIIASIFEEDRNSTTRRWVVAEVICKEEPESMSGKGTRYSTIMVRYPAWGPEAHYTTSLTTHPEGENMPHDESMKIAKELKFAMGFKT